YRSRIRKNYRTGEKIKPIEEIEIAGAAKYPITMKQKLIHEFDSEFLELSSLSDILTYENFPYCDAILTNPPINPRETSNQDEIDGYIISKGSIVVACTDAIHLHKDYWENPNDLSQKDSYLKKIIHYQRLIKI
ncbi:4888_t:CDS:2, partial [Racocetra persica]